MLFTVKVHTKLHEGPMSSKLLYLAIDLNYSHQTIDILCKIPVLRINMYLFRLAYPPPQPIPLLDANMDAHLFLEPDSPFLDISALEDVYINFGTFSILYLLLIHKRIISQAYTHPDRPLYTRNCHTIRTLNRSLCLSFS